MKRFLIALLFTGAATAQFPVANAPYQLFDASSGVALPCSGCSIYSYIAGASENAGNYQNTYTDYTLGTANTNPVLTNSAGYAVNGSTITGIWVTAAPPCYKFVAKKANGDTLWTQDHICVTGTNAALIVSGTLAAARGGTGISNTATLKLGTTNVDLAALGTGIVYHTTTSGALAVATAANVVTAFSGCSGTLYLGADGACHIDNLYNKAAFTLTGANFNTASDQTLSLTLPAGYTRYVIRHIVISNASVNMTTAVGGIYTGTGKSGVLAVANTQVYTALTDSSHFLDCTLTSDAQTIAFTLTPLYFSLTTPQGVTATADINIFVEFLP